MTKVRSRLPTIAEASDWIKKMAHDPEYCRSCLTMWKKSMGIAAAKRVFDGAPDSVREWIIKRRG